MLCLLLSLHRKKMRNTELKFTGCAKYVKYVFGSNFKCVVSDNTMLHNTGSKIPLSIYKKRFFFTFFADRFGLEMCFTSFQYWIRKEIFKKKKKVMGKLKVCFFCAFQQNVKITPGSYISKIYSSSAILRSICKVNIQQTYHSSKIFIQTTFRHSKSI